MRRRCETAYVPMEVSSMFHRAFIHSHVPVRFVHIVEVIVIEHVREQHDTYRLAGVS